MLCFLVNVKNELFNFIQNPKKFNKLSDHLMFFLISQNFLNT